MSNLREISPDHIESDRTFSICTLITDFVQYRCAIESFEARGFNTKNSEFLYIDNTHKNFFDGYSGIAEFLKRSSAKYIIVCHQDVELIDDGFNVLVEKLAELDRIDPLWAIAGNAGLCGPGDWVMRITDRFFENARIGEFPCKVDSLDENTLILKKSALVAPSADLSGFHFYGLDLCLQSKIKGCNAYVIDFHLHHHGSGTKSPSYYECRDALERKYAKLLRFGIIQTTCDLVFLGPAFHIRFLRWFAIRLLRVFSKYGPSQTI
ncbi:MAG: hypothetical protein P4L72_09295 [Parvibaculum sp.]|uniref:hypothetical protein n=1 Tax=Parvibaculum sp. TaxID=2024848 RepID=UPI00283BF190|nr:hypothetical protein [Parvibaculum sp.]MDR3499409.1 hypothetical protein [Parvibaculum sp.]